MHPQASLGVSPVSIPQPLCHGVVTYLVVGTDVGEVDE